MKIKILDAIECEISVPDGRRLIPCLSFKSSYWKQGPYKKVKVEYQRNVFSFKGKQVWRFYTGLLPRVLAWCKKNRIDVEVIGKEIKIPRQAKPNLKGITFRDDQLKMIDTACEKQRGNLIAPTQSGKTIVFLGILSCYPKLNILILAHSTTITKQTHERLIKHGFKNVELFGGGNKVKKPTKRITISTIQSFASLDPKVYSDYYDIVIVDEQHRVSKIKSQYSDVLSQLLAPIRLGFSATPKEDDPEARFTFEGLLGPIISRLSLEEATNLEILQKPRIELINSIMPSEIASVYKYQDTYEKIRKNGKLVNGKRLEIGAYSAGVVENKYRTNQIAELVQKKLKKNKIIFIFVTYTLHGQLIQEAIKQKTGVDVPFVEGSTPMVLRDKIKQSLKSKKIKVCIASNAWGEGLTIKTITDLMLTGGGRSELQLMQRSGRVLANEDVTITYFLDSKNKHLALQSMEILSVFVEKGWI